MATAATVDPEGLGSDHPDLVERWLKALKERKTLSEYEFTLSSAPKIQEILVAAGHVLSDTTDTTLTDAIDKLERYIKQYHPNQRRFAFDFGYRRRYLQCVEGETPTLRVVLRVWPM